MLLMAPVGKPGQPALPGIRGEAGQYLEIQWSKGLGALRCLLFVQGSAAVLWLHQQRLPGAQLGSSSSSSPVLLRGEASLLLQPPHKTV